jgi:hypothetical protein
MGFVRKKTGGVTQPFPEKLMELLMKETEVPAICGWLPHGRAFIVRKPKAFTGEIMPKVCYSVALLACFYCPTLLLCMVVLLIISPFAILTHSPYHERDSTFVRPNSHPFNANSICMAFVASRKGLMRELTTMSCF